MALVHQQGSGKHRRVVCAIKLVTLLWADGDRHVPVVDWRVYGNTMGKARGFAPACVSFDNCQGLIVQSHMRLIRTECQRQRHRASQDLQPDQGLQNFVFR
jgi:hypothetical protein